MSRYQKGKLNLDFTEARDSEWQWHQPGRMQVCTLLQTDDHASTPPLSFLQAGCPSCRPTNSIKERTVNHSTYLQRSADPERVARVDGFVWSSVEAGLLSEETPSAQCTHLSCRQRAPQPIHQDQRSHRTERAPTYMLTQQLRDLLTDTADWFINISLQLNGRLVSRHEYTVERRLDSSSASVINHTIYLFTLPMHSLMYSSSQHAHLSMLWSWFINISLQLNGRVASRHMTSVECRHHYAAETGLVIGFCVNHTIVTDLTIRQPGFDVPRHTWSLMNRFWTGQGPCRANLHTRGLAQSPSCDCGQRQTTNHIVNT